MLVGVAHWERLGKNLRTFERLTGLTVAQFEELAERIEPRFAAADRKRLTRRPRRRAVGAGRRYALSARDQLLMTLIYYRCYVTHVFLGFLFGMDDSTSCRAVNRIAPLLAAEFRIPERRVTLDPQEITTLFLTPRSVRSSARAA